MTPAPTEARRRSRTVDVTLGTHNAGDKPDYAVVMDMLRDGVAALGLQEVADQSPEDFNLARWVGMFWPTDPILDPDTGRAVPGSHNVRENPILWDKRVFRLYRSGSYFLTPVTPVGHEGAGGNEMHAKYLNWVALRHLDLGETIVVGNEHTVPSIQINDARGDLMRGQIAGSVAWANRRPADRILTLLGDLNADIRRKAEAEFLAPLAEEARLRSCWTEVGHSGGSLGPRGIDHVLLRDHDRVEFVGMDVLSDRGFDHHPTTATIRVRRK